MDVDEYMILGWVSTVHMLCPVSVFLCLCRVLSATLKKMGAVGSECVVH